MRLGRIRVGIILSAIVLAGVPAHAKKTHQPPNQVVDPTCPVDKNGRPDAECSRATPELSKVKCPSSLTDIDCDYYRQGYDAALEDKKVMSETESGKWKDDTGDSSAYKSGYEAGWRK